ncbi:tetratricopeptide repeat protein [Citromicrobium bathyomarinum]|uniref:tetratricopeptide repeat protein n=1 Tax=Citromicrobium bathyomarinum TaxID=72174 RepID=UPI00315B391A
MAVCAVGSPASAQDAGEAMDEALHDALGARRAGDVGKAQDIISSAVTAFEDSFEDGVDVYCASSPTATITYMALAASQKHKAIAVTDSYCDARFLLAYQLAEEGTYAAAAQAIERVLVNDPMNSHYLNELGFARSHAGDLAGGLEAYRSAQGCAGLADESDQPHWTALALRGQGWVLIEQGKWDEAEAAFHESLEFEPDSEVAQSELNYIAQNRN